LSRFQGREQIAIASSVNFRRSITGRGEASERDRSETASPMVSVPRSSAGDGLSGLESSASNSSSMVDGRHFLALCLCATASCRAR
jgi:hypothetical protein